MKDLKNEKIEEIKKHALEIKKILKYMEQYEYPFPYEFWYPEDPEIPNEHLYKINEIRDDLSRHVSDFICNFNHS